jgi:hypothetical protein
MFATCWPSTAPPSNLCGCIFKDMHLKGLEKPVKQLLPAGGKGFDRD